MAIYTSGTVLDNGICTWRWFGSSVTLGDVVWCWDYWLRGATAISRMRRQGRCSDRYWNLQNTNASPTGVPHLLVNMIFANNARYCDKESASGGHLLELPKNGSRVRSNFTKFARRKQKRAYFLLSFEKWELKSQKVQEVLEYLRYFNEYSHKNGSVQGFTWRSTDYFWLMILLAILSKWEFLLNGNMWFLLTL